MYELKQNKAPGAKGLPPNRRSRFARGLLALPGTPLRLRGYNYNFSCCYPRRMADLSRNGMLFSSGDSPKRFNDPLGGWAR
jgi:hypothetical protein